MPPWVHTLFECLAFFIGGRVFWHLREKHEDTLNFDQRLIVITGCALGALIGAKAIVLIEHWNPLTNTFNATFTQLMSSGKGIVGALAGGWFGVELVKKLFHIHSKSGDLFVWPLILGIIIGRIGCFLSGYYDQTYGIESNFLWAVNFGDGIFRHPTQLYEIIFMMLLGLYFRWRQNQPYLSGDLFRIFIFAYAFFRFWVEFIKPTPHPFWGLNPNQVLTVLMMFFSFPSLELFYPTVKLEQEKTDEFKHLDDLEFNQ